MLNSVGLPAVKPLVLGLLRMGYIDGSRWELASFPGNIYVWSGGPALTFFKGSLHIRFMPGVPKTVGGYDITPPIPSKQQQERRNQLLQTVVTPPDMTPSLPGPHIQRGEVNDDTT